MKLAQKPFSPQIILGIGIIASICSLGVSLYWFKTSKQFQPTVGYEQSKSSQRSKVVALGRIEPEGEIISVAGPTGERVAELKVSEGDSIEAGAVIAYLDSYHERLAQRELAASQVEEIKKQITTDSLLQQTEIVRSQIDIERAKQPSTLEIESQQATIRRLQAELANAVRERARFQYLHTEGAVPEQLLDSKQLMVNQIEENLKQAQSNLEKLVSVRNLRVQSSQTNLRTAQVNLQRVNSHSKLQSAIHNLKLTQTQLDRAVIRAPRRGQVLKVFTYAGEAINEAGILQMGNTQRMYVTAEVYEADVRSVKPGQRATITSPALAKPISGTVRQIGRLIYKNNLLDDDPAADSDARVVEVKISLDQTQEVAQFSNLQVDVQIQFSN